MKNRIIYLLIFIFPSLLFCQKSSLFDSYKIPTYTYHSLNIYGQDFFSFLKTNHLDNGYSEEHINMTLGSNEYYLSQSLMATHYAQGVALLNYSKDKSGTGYYGNNTESSVLSIILQSFNDWYLTHSKGLFIHFDPALKSVYKFSDNLKSNLVDLPFGLGFGRIVNVKSIVQSYIISDELKAQLSNEDLLKLAEIIEKYDNGFYTAKYRDDSEIIFYQDIATITNKPESAKKIEQILDSPIYKTSQRQMGYEVKLGINLTLASAEQLLSNGNGYQSAVYDNGTDLVISGRYALPIDFDKQLIASASYSKNPDDGAGRMPKLSLTTTFAFDHNYHWASRIWANYKNASPEYGDKLTNFSLGLRSEYAFINTCSVYGSFSYEYRQFTEIASLQWSPVTQRESKTESLEFHLGFNYYIE